MSKSTSSIKEALMTFDKDRLIEETKRGLNEGLSPHELLDAITDSLKEVGDKFESGEFFLAELINAGEAAKIVISEYLEPAIKKSGSERESIGRILLGTVAGDIHDIGKSIVSSMLFTAGFDVVDLGVDVAPDKFVTAVREHNPEILGMSALLTTTLPMQKETIEALKKSKLRDQVKVIVGGSPVNEGWVNEIGADGYSEDAIGAVKLVKKILKISD
ncbi:MAG: corrinoid protein [Candidatus Bathyarchaeota archaeon]|nr:corrinoid protein [Candidatus Bathyarchaeota archaeon]